jgi:hypothetical protein
MVAFNHEPTMTVVVIKSKHRNNGVYVALVPDGLEAEEIDVALRKMKLDPIRVCPLENWVEAENGVSVAFVPNMATG